MKRGAILCWLMACALAKPEGFYHQEMQYSRKAESYRNNELERREGDEGFYSKHGDLEGRAPPKVNSHSTHSEYENPKFRNQGTSGNLMYGQSGSGSGFYDDYSSKRFGSNLHQQQQQGLGYGAYHGSGSSNFDSRASASQHFASGGGSSFGTHGGYTRPSMSSQLQEMSRQLHEDMSRQLQSAIRNQYQTHESFSSSSSSSSGFSNYINADIVALEQEMRRNLTRQLQDALSNQYQTHANTMPYPFTSSGEIATEFEELKQHVEQNLIKEITEGVRNQYRPVVQNRPVLEYREPYQSPASDQRHSGSSSWSSGNNFKTSYQPQYTEEVVQPVPLSEVTSKVETVVDRNLQQALIAVERQFNEQTSQTYTSSGRTNVDFTTQLQELTDQLVQNITDTLNAELIRTYGSYASRGSNVYASSSSQPIFTMDEYEKKKQEIRDYLVRKLDKSYRQKYNDFIQRTSYVSSQQSDSSTDYYQQPVVRPNPLTSGGQQSSSVSSSSHNRNYGYRYTPSEYPEPLQNVANVVQSDLSRQLQNALVEQENKLSHMSYSSHRGDQPNYQQTLQHLQDELKRNFTNKLDDSLRRYYRVESQSGSYFFSSGSGSNTQNQQQMQQQLQRLKDSLQNQLMQQLEQGMAQQQSYYSSSSSSSSASSGYKSARLSHNPSSSYSQKYGTAYEEDCETQGDESYGQHRLRRSADERGDTRDLVQQTEDVQQKDLEALTQEQEPVEVLPQQKPSTNKRVYPAKTFSRPRTGPRQQTGYSQRNYNRPNDEVVGLTQQVQQENWDPLPTSRYQPGYTKPIGNLNNQVEDLTQQQEEPKAPLTNFDSTYKPFSTGSSLVGQVDLTQQQEPAGSLVQESQSPIRNYKPSYTSSYQPHLRRPITYNQNGQLLTQQQEQTADLHHQQRQSGSLLQQHEDSQLGSYGSVYTPRNQPSYSGYNDNLEDLTQQQVHSGDLVQQETPLQNQGSIYTPRYQAGNYDSVSSSSIYQPSYSRPYYNTYQPQDESLTQQQEELGDLTHQVQTGQTLRNHDSLSHTRYQPSYFRPSNNKYDDHDKDLTQQQEQTEDWTHNAPGNQRDVIKPSTYEPKNQFDDLTQQQEQIEDLTQQKQSDDFVQPYSTPRYSTGGSNRSVGQVADDLTQQQEEADDLTQKRQPHDLVQVNRYPLSTSRYQPGINVPVGQFEDLTQQQKTEDLTQQKQIEDLTQQKQTEDLTQQQQIEDLTQQRQTEDYLNYRSTTPKSRYPFGNGRPEHIEDLTQQEELSEDLTQQAKDLTQQQEQTEDLTQKRQSGDYIQKQDDHSPISTFRHQYNKKPGGDLTQEQEQAGDLTHKSEGLVQQQETSPLLLSADYHLGDLTQQQEQTEDLSQQQVKPINLGQQHDDWSSLSITRNQQGNRNYYNNPRDHNTDLSHDNVPLRNYGSQTTSRYQPYNHNNQEIEGSSQQEQVEDLSHTEHGFPSRSYVRTTTKPRISYFQTEDFINQENRDQRHQQELLTQQQQEEDLDDLSPLNVNSNHRDQTQPKPLSVVGLNQEEEDVHSTSLSSANSNYNSRSGVYSSYNRPNKPSHSIGQGAQYELETEHLPASRPTPKVNYANQGQIEDEFKTANEFYSLTTEKQNAHAVDHVSNIGVKGGRRPYQSQALEQYQVETTAVPAIVSEVHVPPQEVPTENQDPGFWKKVGSRIENTFNKAKQAASTFAEKIKTSVG